MRNFLSVPLTVCTTELLNLFQDKVIIFFDTETTGLNPHKGQLTEIAAIATKAIPRYYEGQVIKLDFEYIARFHKKCELSKDTKYKMSLEGIATEFIKNPLNTVNDKMLKRKLEIVRYCNIFAEVCNNIKTDKTYRTIKQNLKMTRYENCTADCVTESNAITELVDFCNDFDNVILVAQNIKFDMRYINVRADYFTPEILKPNTNLRNFPGFDTKVIFTNVLLPLMQVLRDNNNILGVQFMQDYPINKNGLPSSSLGAIMPRFHINATKWHSAIADTTTMIDAFEYAIATMIAHDNCNIKPYQENIVKMEKYYEQPKFWTKWKPKLYNGRKKK